jgi:hypothetical protein
VSFPDVLWHPAACFSVCDAAFVLNPEDVIELAERVVLFILISTPGMLTLQSDERAIEFIWIKTGCRLEVHFTSKKAGSSSEP